MNEQGLTFQMLPDKSLRSLKEHTEPDLWEYASTRFRMQRVIVRMEKQEHDPDVLKDLASRTIDLSSELDAILAILENSVEE